MRNNNLISKLTIILFITVILIGGILYLKYNQNYNQDNSFVNNVGNEQENIKGNNMGYIEVSSEVEKPTHRTIVSDKFVSKLDPNSNIVVLGEDGRIISVDKGVVLVSGVVINSQEDSYSVYRIDNPEKSVSTN